MSNVLILTSSALGEASVSSKLAHQFGERLQAREPSASIVTRDVGIDPLPHLTAETVGGIRGAAKTEAEKAAATLSDVLIAEIAAADLIVIGSPMYNFGISSTLKAWFDHVLRAGITFRYTEAGPEGLMTGKRAIVIESRAGLYSEGPAAAMDGQEPHLRTMLGFMGIDDVEFIRAERLAFGPDAADESVAAAARRLAAIASEGLALAA